MEAESFHRLPAQAVDAPRARKTGRFLDLAGGMICAGLFMLPVSLCMVTKNELAIMCRESNAVLAAQDMEEISCGSPQDAKVGHLVYLSCPIEESSLEIFNPATMNRKLTKDEDFANALEIRSVIAAQRAEMYQCVESWTKKEGYTYGGQWVDHLIDTAFFQKTQEALGSRSSGCRNFTGRNAPWPSNVDTSLQIRQAGSVVAGGLNLLKPPIDHPETKPRGRGFAVDLTRPVPLGQHATNFKSLGELEVPPASGVEIRSLTTSNAAVDPSGERLITCREAAWGCMRLQYFKSWAMEVSVIARVAAGGNLVKASTRSSWLCGEYEARDWRAVEPGLHTHKELIRELWNHGPEAQVLRVVWWCMVVVAMYCLLRPVVGGPEMLGPLMGNMPCGIGVFLEEMAEDLATNVLCIVAMGSSCSLVMFILGFIWVWCRPLFGTALLAASCLSGLFTMTLVQQVRQDSIEKARWTGRRWRESEAVASDDDGG